MLEESFDQINRCKEFELYTINDKEGNLGVIEKSDNIPFEPKRTYFIYGVPCSSSRGGHAHKRLEQIFFCPKGSCRVKLYDVKGNQKTFFLNKPNKALYIPNMLWRELDQFSKDTIFVCCASREYEENDYIRSRDEFNNFFKNK